MNYQLRKLEDYTPEEIKKFDDMLRILEEYNKMLGTKDELPLPHYSDHEMAEFSGYRELIIAKECSQ